MLNKNINEPLIGLSDDEVLLNRSKFGVNKTEKKKFGRTWIITKEIITEPVFVILVITAVIYLLLGQYSESIIMLVALFFVSGISLYQENKSTRAIEALKKLSAPRAKVIRQGNRAEVSVEELVMDDLIIAEDGNIVPADAEIIKSNDFSVNESILTGESLPVYKSPESDDRIIRKGTLVVSGSCTARVIGIGSDTAIGRIQTMMEEATNQKTPLQIQIRNFVRSMIGVGTFAFLLVWIANYLITESILKGLLQGLTLAMSILPEEIPVAFSTFMALGAYRLYKQRIIARNPQTVETLGAASVICIDKTGTITENRMQLSQVYDHAASRIFDFEKNQFVFSPVIEYAMWASETEPFDSMEQSIHQVYGATAELDLRPFYFLKHEYPLSGQPPMMTHVFSNNRDQRIIACKGGAEAILKQCNLSDAERIKIENLINEFASVGQRVLAVARSLQTGDLPHTQQEFMFEFLGLIAFSDPPKQNMKNIIEGFYNAGVDVKILTGDFTETAVAIAGQINLKKGEKVVTGTEVLSMSESELATCVKHTTIFSRMFPEAKMKVIEALKNSGEVVAMTGDGVNDAPALKVAHIGIAMGNRGSDVAQKASGLILTDDDLAHMLDAIATGRRIYENLKKAIRYIISIHIPIILIVTLPLLFFWEFTNLFTPVHVIFLELIMGPTCSIIFENEPIESGAMNRPPRKMSSQFFSWNELSLSLVQGIVITISCLGIGYYFMKKPVGDDLVRTIVYTTLIFSNVFLTLVNRSFNFTFLTTIRYKNNLMPVVLFISLIVLFLSIYLPPIRNVFGFAALDMKQVLICMIVAAAGVLWIDVYKMMVVKKADS